MGRRAPRFVVRGLLWLAQRSPLCEAFVCGMVHPEGAEKIRRHLAFYREIDGGDGKVTDDTD